MVEEQDSRSCRSGEASTQGYTVLVRSALLTRDTCQSLCSLAFMCFSKTHVHSAKLM